MDASQTSSAVPTATFQRIFFSPHPDDVAYSAFGTASSRPAPRCCSHDEGDMTVIEPLSHAIFKTKASHHFTPLPSPSLSSSSRMTSDSLLTIHSPTSSSSSSFAESRRNSTQSSSSSCTSATSLGTADSIQNDLIVTVFSKSRCANGEIGARLNRHVENTTILRTEEDEAFARSVGCDLLQLGFPDSSARDEPSRRPDLAAAAMQGAPGARISDVDHYIYKEVRQSLEPIVWMAVRAGAKIHLPLGVGCHVDHWMVRVAVLSILDEIHDSLTLSGGQMTQQLRETLITAGFVPIHERLIFYEDLPYADAQTNDHVQRLAKSVLPCGAKAKLVALSEQDWCKKRAAVLAYASQMKPTILPSLYNHATRMAQLGKAIDPEWDEGTLAKPNLAAERIWVIDAELRRLALNEQRLRQRIGQ